ncbi:smc6 [[Candida] subhashii]|uniref:Smc6 n=1 Tax=[Candida] subhashii TaxID=561895 RepID=A0A8J5QKZ4_9ASCO|nr:smc6 [[Candida] subhashii]KAG7664048.1 smc6 [[Candida] subhashii]
MTSKDHLLSNKRRRDDGGDNDESDETFDPMGEVGVNEFMTQKLTKRRKVTYSDEEEEESDSDSDSDSDADSTTEDLIEESSPTTDQEDSIPEQQVEDDDESNKSAGIIEKLRFENFMCHSLFELELGNQINFVIGSNGSGKSAIFTGIAVGLGCKAHETNRGNSMKDLIKDGTNRAKITIVFKNEGRAAFKPHIYGKRIIIERILNRHGAHPYSIRNESKKKVCSKKSTVAEILTKFGIAIDNPLVFLSQDRAREFLTSSTDKDKYQYFMDGANINQILSNYSETTENIQQIEKKISPAKEHVKARTAEFKEAKELYDRHESQAGLREKLHKLLGKINWFNVEYMEGKVKKFKNRIEETESNLETCEKEILTCSKDLESNESEKVTLENSRNEAQEQYSKIRSEHQAMKDKMKQLSSESSDCRKELEAQADNIKETQREIKRKQAEVDKEQARIDHINGGSKLELQTKVEEINAQLPELENQLSTCQDKIRELRNQYDPEIQELNKKIQDSQSKISEYDKQINSLRRSQGGSDKYAPFGKSMPDIIKRINQTQWAKTPIGPIGIHVVVKPQFKQYKALMNSFLGRTLDSFVVSNEQDRSKLAQILKSYRSRNNIIVRKNERLDFMQGKAPAEFKTIYDALLIQNEEVLNTLIDCNSIERNLLMENTQGSERILRSPNVSNIFAPFGADSGIKVNMAGSTYRQDPVPYRGELDKFGVESKDALIAELRGKLDHERENKRKIEDEISRIREIQARKRRELEIEHKGIEGEIRRLNRELANAQNKLDENVDKTKIEKLSAQIEGLENQIMRYEGIMESMKEEGQKKKAEHERLRPNYKLLKEAVEKANKACSEIQKQIDLQLDKQIQIQTREKEWLNKRTQYQAVLEAATEKLGTANTTLTKLVEVAENVCPREEVTITEQDTKDTIANEYAEIQMRLQAAEESIGISFEEIQKQLAQTKTKMEIAKGELDDLNETYNRLRVELNIRFNVLRTLITAAVNNASRTFEDSLAMRGYRGKLSFEFKDKCLKLLAQTKKDDEMRTVDSLSGGEKSFTQIALLLSIWKVMDSRIRGLDEFDVFMDQINRSISIKLLMAHLQEYPKSQSIFITPQDIAVVGDLNNSMVKIHRMSNPRDD